MKIYDFDSKATIAIPFPEDKFTNHLKKVGVSDALSLTFPKLVELMVNVISDFKKGTMSLDELSEIFEFLAYDGYFRKQPDSLQDRFFEIGNVLESGGELSFYLRSTKEDGQPNPQFAQFYAEVMNFYNKRGTVKKNVAILEQSHKE